MKHQRILHISDTHHRTDLLEGILAIARRLAAQTDGSCLPDLVAVTGDVMGSGFEPYELEAFVSFLDGWAELGVPVAFVPGNHDCPFDEAHFRSKATLGSIERHQVARLLALADEVRQKAHVLINDSAEINGIRVHGFAWQPPFRDWAFNLTDEKRAVEAQFIHPEADVLLLHAPPQGILDGILSDVPRNVGDPLTHEILETGNGLVSVRAHTILFGHVHERGMQRAWRKVGGRWRFFRNGSLLDEAYMPRIEIPDTASNDDPKALYEAMQVWSSLLVSTEPQQDLHDWIFRYMEDVFDNPAYAGCAHLAEENFNDPMDFLEACVSAGGGFLFCVNSSSVLQLKCAYIWRTMLGGA